MSNPTFVLPSCPKCASCDIHRKYVNKGEKFWHGFGVTDRPRLNEFVEVKRFEGIALKECLLNHCRVCGFDFESPVLNDSDDRVTVEVDFPVHRPLRFPGVSTLEQD